MATKPQTKHPVRKITAKQATNSVLRRYTDLPTLLHIIEFHQLTLVSPSNWDDKNDRNFMEAYARAKSLKTCVALCFCERSDTYHHWRVFSPGSAGVCVEFWKSPLISTAEKQGIIHGSMEYLTIPALSSRMVDPDRLPFMKRSAFKDEREYRFIYGSTKEIAQTKALDINFEMIKRVIVNPWSPQPLYDGIVKTIAKLTKKTVTVEQSRLTDHAVWREYASRYNA